MTATATAALLVGFVALFGAGMVIITVCEGFDETRHTGHAHGDEQEDV